MIPSNFTDFLDRLDRTGIAGRESLAGCNRVEISALESKYHITLPATYRAYLEAMGHKSGRLLTHDHYAATYSYVLEMTAQCREDREEFSDSRLPELPKDALVIVGRLGEQFMMIRCLSPDDSPVWYFNEYDGKIKQCFGSVVDWLNSFADEAQEAITSGYYNHFPNGTRP